MVHIYWSIALLASSIVIFKVAFRFGKNSLEPKIRSMEESERSLSQAIDQLNSTVYSLRSQMAENGEWIEVPIILHGLSWSNAAHTFVSLHTKTLQVCASQKIRTVKGEYSEFQGQPKPVLGSPKWERILGNQNEILLLGQVYRWGS